jgi:hypothetical protein
MTYWKFLRPGAVSPFTGLVWPAPGEWVDAGDVSPCHAGIHACRVTDLPYWLVDELWQVELSGPLSTGRHKVVAPRGRLVARVPAWTGDAARELARACLSRTVVHAVAELREAGLFREAERIAELAEQGPVTANLAELATDCANEATRQGFRPAARICGYVSDAVEGFPTYPAASQAYISARAANSRSTSHGDHLYEAERAWQTDWLVERLGLAG